MYDEKAEKLFKAYISKEEIEPFEVNSREEAENIFKLFTNKVVSYEGLGGRESVSNFRVTKGFKGDCISFC